MTRTLDADYLVVGAGAMGMAFTDALIDHADARVALVDRRHGVGGHWLEAYPFVQLHQSSAFYGVPSTLLGGGQLQQQRSRGGPAGARHPAGDLGVLRPRMLDRMRETGRVEFFPNSELRRRPHRGLAHLREPRSEVPETCRIVNAHYLAPSIPAEMPPPFGVGDGVRVVPVNDLARLEEAPSQYVVVGLGQDRHRRLHLAARARRRPGRDLLGAPARPVDVQPGARPARPRDLPRHGRRHDAVGGRRRRRSTTCSSGWRSTASCCASTARSCRRWPRRPPWRRGSSTSCARIENVVRRGHITSVGRGKLDLRPRGRRSASRTTPWSCTARPTV